MNRSKQKQERLAAAVRPSYAAVRTETSVAEAVLPVNLCSNWAGSPPFPYEEMPPRCGPEEVGEDNPSLGAVERLGS